MLLRGFMVSAKKCHVPCDVAVAGAVSKYNKRRPWRNKVRKKARKEAKKAERILLKEGNTVISQAVLKSDVRKKRKRKLKKYVDRNVNVDGEVVAKTSVVDMREKLKAGRFRLLNEQLYTMTGSEALKFFQEDRDAFWCYHNGFANQAQKWPCHPLSSIIQWLKSKPSGSIVCDMGCGEAKLATSLEQLHVVHSFDLVAVSEKVTACDMAHVPLEDSSSDIVVFCLSLMGTNLCDYIKEARRILKIGGSLKIAEVVSRFVNVRLFCDSICKLGFEQSEKMDETGDMAIRLLRAVCVSTTCDAIDAASAVSSVCRANILDRMECICQ